MYDEMTYDQYWDCMAVKQWLQRNSGFDVESVKVRDFAEHDFPCVVVRLNCGGFVFPYSYITENRYDAEAVEAMLQNNLDHLREQLGA